VTPFDFVKSITYNKKNMMKDTDNDELSEQSYVPYVVNKGLSYFVDTLMYANEMNISSFLDHKLQYEYLLNSIRPKKRYAKWVKNDEDSDLKMIEIYFNYSTKKALQAQSVLSQEEMVIIREKITRGITDD